MNTKKIYLSHILDEKTPTYGGRNIFRASKKSDISKGDIANDTSIETTVHIGTHLDMPYHFFENGQTIENFNIEFFECDNVLYIDLNPEDLIIHKQLISILEKVENKESYNLLLIKTGICHKRHEKEFYESNYGFHPDIAQYLRINFKNIRILGFDSISVSSFMHRALGRKAHYAFLNPDFPILILEDMDLRQLTTSSKIRKVTIAPLRIARCDGLPCTVIAEVLR